MVDRVRAAGITLSECGKPAFNASGAIAVTCFTGDPLEGVAFDTFELPTQGETLARALAANGWFSYGEDGWTVAAKRGATLRRLQAALATVQP